MSTETTRRKPTGQQVRTEPGEIVVTTRWRSSPPRDGDRECICCPGDHVFHKGSDVIESGWPFWADQPEMNDLTSHIHRAVASFGDNTAVRITVEMADQVRPTVEDLMATFQDVLDAMRDAGSPQTMASALARIERLANEALGAARA